MEVEWNTQGTLFERAFLVSHASLPEKVRQL
jgi:hypothetical protein